MAVVPGRKHRIRLYLNPKNIDHPRWRAEYNDGHAFIRGGGEHPLAQLYTWAVCRDPSTKLGMGWE